MDLKLAGFFIFSCLSLVNCQQFGAFRICAYRRHEQHCNQLQRGASIVNCVYVQDAIECAQRIRNGTAEFGIFTAENAFHIATMQWQELVVIKELRHTSRIREDFDYQSVVIVNDEHQLGVQNLRDVNFCHPGLNRKQQHERWTEAFLKHFERQVVPVKCRNDTTPAEIEAQSMSQHFSAACRPGFWSYIEEEDAELKKRYENLCALCDNPETCSYEENGLTSHQSALRCLTGEKTKDQNRVTYVALQEAQEFFAANSGMMNEYKYLCPNGTYQTIENNEKPCTWLTQPWSVIASNNDQSLSLSLMIQRWTQLGATDWESAVTSILTSDGENSIYILQNIVPLVSYINVIRPIPAPKELCQTTSKWCTNSYEEREKCDVLKAVALTLGILPIIECNNPRSSVVSCLDDVNKRDADFVGIDSNYGFLARHVYNLTTLLYEEPLIENQSSVVAVIKNTDVEKISSFEDLRGKRACFPEYGGIASITFINIVKNQNIIPREECNFGSLLGDYFGDSCMPGSRDILHDRGANATNPDSLCALCQTQAYTTTSTMRTTQDIRPLAGALEDGQEEVAEDEISTTPDGIEGSDGFVTFAAPINREVNCAASPGNRFFGTRGALTCLNEVGDVAMVEFQRLNSYAASLGLNPNDFRIICRNGSLATFSGFNVDQECATPVIVDGEIVVRRDNVNNKAIQNALVSLDWHLRNDPNFKMYEIYGGERDLLFEDNTIGLVSPTGNIGESVRNYMQLFNDVENCIADNYSGDAAAVKITSTLLVSLALILFTVIIRN